MGSAQPPAPRQSADLDSLLRDFSLRPVASRADLRQQLCQLHAAGLSALPHPAGGATLRRWQALAKVAAADLSLVKLFEAHADALAILHELAPERPLEPGLWAVWAAEPPYAQVRIQSRQGRQLRLAGRKAWCSGAAHVDHALMTVRDEQDRPQLVAIALRQPGVQVTSEGWQAVGMAAADSLEIVFEQAVADSVGRPHAYVERPGFWHGAAGIAACWYGAGVAIGERLRQPRGEDPHGLAHLGAIEVALGTARDALRQCAQWLDEHPGADAEFQARRLRALVEAALEQVMRHAGRALGATPFCRDPHFARLMADLPVFLRQSHAERDLQCLGQLLPSRPAGDWRL